VAIQYNLLDKGFKNVRQNGNITGFQLGVISAYYRGVYVPIVDSFEVRVDGESFQGKQIKCGFNGKTYEQSPANQSSVSPCTAMGLTSGPAR
jgi:uncharacterized protein DUF6379